MKRHVDLDRAADGEVFGALAVGRRRKHRHSGAAGRQMTPAQMRALSDLAGSLVEIARDAGAAGRRITIGNVSFDLQETEAEEILSIRKATAS